MTKRKKPVLRLVKGGRVKYDLVPHSALDDVRKEWEVPSERARRGLKVGAAAQILVCKDEREDLQCWVVVVEVTPTGYVGTATDLYESPRWVKVGTRVVFTPDCIIDLPDA